MPSKRETSGDTAAAAAAAGGSWLVGGGEMGKVVRAKDWSTTPLGPIESWSQSLRTAVSLCLSSNFPISLAWGPKHIQIYNDGYWPICGDMHPQAMGMDASECWASAWPVIGEAFATALSGTAAYLESQRMFLDRYGFLEETFFTFSFSPIRDESGGVGGLLNPVTDMTAQALSERRARCLHDLAARTGRAQSAEDALALAAKTLAGSDLDLPFVLFYLLDESGREARLVAHAGLPPGSAASPEQVLLASPPARCWPLSQVAELQRPCQVDDLIARFGPIECGPYPEPPRTALVLPISAPGAPRALAIMVAGVSSRLALTEAYRAHYDMLANVVTGAVVNARTYAEERKRAEALAEIDRAKTAFFSNISHELRTPLTLLLGPLEDELAERESPLPPGRWERLEAAHRNSLRLLKLVNSLLDFSRIEAGRMRASYEPVDLSAVTAEVASVFRAAIEKAGLSLVIDCPPLPEHVRVDREMWEKIILNLLSNAFKHTFQGTIAVSLRWLGASAELAVSDSGIGIAAAELPRLFERFHRVKDARSRSHEGTGIGLALVRELVSLHGGEIRVESEEGKGSTFRVTLLAGDAHLPKEPATPVSPEPTGAAAVVASTYVEEALHWLPQTPAPPVKRSASPSGDLGPLLQRAAVASRILWCDDNVDMREYVRRLLAEQYKVTAVGDGLAALEAARREPPDLVLSDVMMPGLDGFGLLRELRADPRTATIPVLLLSARAGEEAAIEGLAAGADDYVTKPFTAKELLARVRAQLTMSSLRREWEKQLVVANKQLDQALREAQAAREEALSAARTRAEFLAAMSHEIRTPMNAVLGFSALLSETELTSRQQELVESIRSGGDHLLGIINDILDLSKLEAGRFELSRTTFNLRGTVESALGFVAAQAAAKGIALGHIVDPRVPEGVEADEARLRQILINYLSNAVKFTDAGEVLVRVRSRPIEGDGRHELHFSVHDTGPGVAPERMHRLFQEFSQTGAEIANKYGGTGLGLIICKRLAELHGGRVWAESTPGTGSVFHLAIPVKARTVSAPRLPRGRTVKGEMPPLRILLVEDNAMNQKLALSMLDRMGYDADVAGDGRKGVQAVKDKTYDVILMDSQMPEMDGLTAARSIRALGEQIQQPHIIAMTANAMAGDREACLIAGMDDYLSKPIGLQRLAEALRSAAAARSGAGAPAPEVNIAVLQALVKDLSRAGTAPVVDTFMSDASQHLEEMRRSTEQRDAQAVAAAAHQLKAGLFSLGAEALGKLCEKLDEMSRRGIIDGPRVSEIERRLARVMAELTAARDVWAEPAHMPPSRRR